MPHDRTRRPARLAALTLVAVLAVGCSALDPATAQERVYDQARDLGQALSEASAATQDANTGFAEPAFAARSIERASSESRQLAEVATQSQSGQIRSIGAELTSVADRAVNALSQGDVQRAELIRTNEFIPLASQLADLKRTLPVPSAAEASSSTGTNLTTALMIVAVVIGGVVLYIKRRAAGVPTVDAPGHDSEHTQHQPEASTRRSRSWNTSNPSYESSTEDEPAPNDDHDAHRTTKVRPIVIELFELLESTLEQVKDRGWDVSLVCPEVHISGDPIRVQRAILAALGNAYLGDPDRVGIIVEEQDGQVKLSIGHDAPIDETTTENLAVRLANQLELALATLDLTWAVAYDDEISLITVALGASIDDPERTAASV